MIDSVMLQYCNGLLSVIVQTCVVYCFSAEVRSEDSFVPHKENVQSAYQQVYFNTGYTTRSTVLF